MGFLRVHLPRFAVAAFALVLAGAGSSAHAPAQTAAQAATQMAAQRPGQTPAETSALDLAPCDRPAIAGRVECGTLRVPENRARPSARSISLFFVVARATARTTDITARATDDPVFFFTGGPGSAASNSAGALSAQLAPLRATRDFVFIDQRGTGRSAPLPCAFADDPLRRLAPMFDAGESAACLTALARSADLRFYTTSDAALDVDDVRKALGYGRINLHGSSYGTRSAWAYAARFPDHARAMLLHGPAPPGFHLPVPFARGLDAAIEGVVAACLADAPCAERFPSLRRDVARAFDQVRAKPARVTIAAGGGGSAASAGTGRTAATDATGTSDGMREGALTYGELAEAVRYQLYTVGGARNLPSLLTRAAAGDYSPIVQASIANRRRLEQQLSRGMFLSVTCAEDVPFMDEATIRASSASTRLGDYRVRQQIAACRDWPRGESRWWRGPSGATSGGPSGATSGATSSATSGATSSGASAPRLQVPALVQVGEFDPATPLVQARRALQLLPNGHLMIVPHGAHAFGGLGVDGCISRVTATFLARGSAKDLDSSCVAAAKRPPFNLQ